MRDYRIRMIAESSVFVFGSSEIDPERLTQFEYSGESQA